MAYRTWLALGSLCGFVVLGGVSATASGDPAPSTLVDESFTAGQTTSPDWVLPTSSGGGSGNDACLTAATNTSQTPIPGCPEGAAGSQPGLQLTTDDTSQEGGLAYGSTVPSSQGLDVSFDSYQYGTTGPGGAADGIAFFLAASDPSTGPTPITLGPFGGSLGYSTTGGTDGLTNGYLGVGLDVYGNYASSSFGDSNCTSGDGNFRPEALVVRGPGNGTAGYCVLNAATVDGALNDESGSPQPVHVEAAINPTGQSFSWGGGDPVPAGQYAVVVTPIGGSAITESGTLPDASGLYPSGWTDSNGVPLQLSFGWTGSTGAAVDFHTISGASVTTLSGTPPSLAVGLTDDSNGTAHSGQTVTYTATPSVSAAAESQQITLNDTFPEQLTPQPGAAQGTGWTCALSETDTQTVTCTHAGAGTGPLPPVTMPVTVGALDTPTSISDTVTVGSTDATPGSATDTQTYSPAPAATATALSFTSQPVDAQVNSAMKNADSTTTHVKVAADVTAGGAVDPDYSGNVSLKFANNPGGAHFVVNNVPTDTLTATAQNGVADFSPIIVDTVGYGYTLVASATGLTSTTSSSFDVSSAATSCPSGQSCNVSTTSTGTGQSAVIQAQPGPGNAIITAGYGGNVGPIHPCKASSPGILTFSGNRQKIITLKLASHEVGRFCYGQPTPFRDVSLRWTTYFNPVNNDYEGVLPFCQRHITGPCVKSITRSKHGETVVIRSAAADPHLSH